MLKSLNSCCCCCCFVWSDSLGWLQDSLGGLQVSLPFFQDSCALISFQIIIIVIMIYLSLLSSFPSCFMSLLSSHFSFSFSYFFSFSEREREREILWDASKIPGSLCESAKVSSRKELSQSVPRKRASLGRGWDSQGCSRILDPN